MNRNQRRNIDLHQRCANHGVAAWSLYTALNHMKAVRLDLRLAHDTVADPVSRDHIENLIHRTNALDSKTRIALARLLKGKPDGARAK